MVCLRKDGWLAGEVRRRGHSLEIRALGRLPDLGWLCELRRIALANGVSAIHAHEFAMNTRGAMLARWLGVPGVATVHGKAYYHEKWTRRLAFKAASRMTNMVAVSEDIRGHLIKSVGLSPGRVSVIPNGVDTVRFRFDARNRLDMRRRMGVKENEVLLGAVGSYYPVKGHRFLIDAMQKLIVSNRNLKLVLAGQGPLEQELRKQVNETGLEACAQIVGYIEDIPGFLSALDIFVMPSLSEGQPLALLEAAANGRCVVATSVGGIPEVVINRKNGILVPPGDVDALAGALADLLRDPALRQRLSTDAVSAVERDWAIQRAADRYLALLLPLSEQGFDRAGIRGGE
jgi:glycosyltransferase involved in cell wall biosynthesis